MPIQTHKQVEGEYSKGTIERVRIVKLCFEETGPVTEIIVIIAQNQQNRGNYRFHQLKRKHQHSDFISKLVWAFESGGGNFRLKLNNQRIKNIDLLFDEKKLRKPINLSSQLRQGVQTIEIKTDWKFKIKHRFAEKEFIIAIGFKKTRAQSKKKHLGKVDGQKWQFVIFELRLMKLFFYNLFQSFLAL